MKALLLAAGLGTRLRPLTLKMPKCLVPINDRPLLDYWLETLLRADIRSVMINLHYKADLVREFVKNSPYSQEVTLVHEPRLLGTAGTLLKNREFFKDDQIMMIHADNYSVFDMASFISAHMTRPQQCEMTMMTFVTDTPESCGILELDSQNVVQAFHEKVKNPPGNLANGAVYILENSILEFLEQMGEEIIDFSTQVLPHYLGRIYTFENKGYHRDIGTMESYKKAQEKQ